MMSRRLLLLLALLCTACASAQETGRRAELRAAFTLADAGRLDLSQATRFSSDPLYPWLQATVLSKQIDSAPAPTVQAALERMGDTPAGRWLRTAWLKETIKREDWSSFRNAYRGSDDAFLRCADLQARSGSTDAQWIADATQVWLTGESLPERCNGPLAQLAAMGKLDDALRWRRIDLAIEQGEASLVRYIGKDLAADAVLAQSYADYMATPVAAIPSFNVIQNGPTITVITVTAADKKLFNALQTFLTDLESTFGPNGTGATPAATQVLQADLVAREVPA